MISSLTPSMAQVAFKGNDNKLPKQSAADNFLAGVKKEDEKSKKGSFLSRNFFWSNTATLPVLAGLLIYEVIMFSKGKKLKAGGKTEEVAKFCNKMIRNLIFGALGGIAAIFGLQHWFRKDSEKHYNDAKEYFNSVNKTNAKLAPDSFISGAKGALFTAATGEVHLNQNILDDPLGRIKNKGLIRHELVHAKQFETIARSKDGIKKVNYSCLAGVINIAKKNPLVKKEFDEIYNEIQQDKTGKYDNMELPLPYSKVHFKNYITAIHILLNDKNATYNDLPVFINAKHYEEVIKKEGPLSKEEEAKADAYFDAAVKYTPLNVFNMFNPFSSYYNNILEKEAYKENPWYTRII